MPTKVKYGSSCIDLSELAELLVAKISYETFNSVNIFFPEKGTYGVNYCN